jgi:hypothetical protein
MPEKEQSSGSEARRPHRGRQRLADQGRATLLWGLAFVALANAGLFLAAEWRWPGLYDPEFGQKLFMLRQHLAGEPDRPLLVVLGSSRSAEGFCPGALPPQTTPDGRVPMVFNCAQPRSGPLAELVWLDRLLRHGVRPDWLAVEVLPPLLGRPSDQFGNVDLGWGLMTASDLCLVCRYAPEATVLASRWCRGLLSPWYSHRFQLMSVTAPDLLPARVRQDWFVADPWGWSGADEADPDPRGIELARATYAGMLADFHLQPSQDRALRDLLTLCRDEGIPVLLYLMPEGSRFQAWYPPAVRSAIEAYLLRLGEEFAVPIVDARNWVPDEYLWDTHHLDARGARMFSCRFGTDVLPAFFRGRPNEIGSLLRPAPTSSDPSPGPLP